MSILSTQPSHSTSAGERALWSIAYLCLQPGVAAKNLSVDQGDQLCKMGMVLATDDSVDQEKLKQFTQFIDGKLSLSEKSNRKFLDSLPHFSLLSGYQWTKMHWNLFCLRISCAWRSCFGKQSDYQTERSEFISSIVQPALLTFFAKIEYGLQRAAQQTPGWNLTFQEFIEELAEQRKPEGELQAFSNMLAHLGLHPTAFDNAIIEAGLSQSPPPEKAPSLDADD